MNVKIKENMEILFRIVFLYFIKLILTTTLLLTKLLTLTQKSHRDKQSYQKHHRGSVFCAREWKQLRISATEELQLFGAAMHKNHAKYFWEVKHTPVLWDKKTEVR